MPIDWQAEKRMLRIFVPLVLAFGIMALLMFAARPREATSPPASQPAQQDQPKLKAELRAESADDPFVLVGNTYEDYSRLVDYAIAQDTDGMIAMVAVGRVLEVPSGTRIEVYPVDDPLKPGAHLLHKVYMVDGPHSGRMGYVDRSYVFVGPDKSAP